jgi:hypothetical protein
MSAQASVAEYMLFRGNDWDKKLSPEKLQETMSRWTERRAAHRVAMKMGRRLREVGEASSFCFLPRAKRGRFAYTAVNEIYSRAHKKCQCGCPAAGSFIRRLIVNGDRPGERDPPPLERT